jgi:hypothetical protein
VAGGPRIYVGHCKANTGLEPKPEEIVIATRSGNLHVCSGDSGPGDMPLQRHL